MEIPVGFRRNFMHGADEIYEKTAADSTRETCAWTRSEPVGSARLEHFQEKWNPVFRPKMRQCKMLERFQFPVNVKPL
jgi:hypothetical protein